MRCSIHTSSFQLSSIAQRASKAKNKKTKKKKPGAGKTKGACEKGLCGGTKKAPIPDKKALDAARPWVPGPTGYKRCRQNPTKGGGQYAPAQRRSPWPSLGRGAGEISFTHFGVITYSGFLDKVWPQNEKGKRKTRQKKRKKPLPPRVPRKGPRKGRANQLTPH